MFYEIITTITTKVSVGDDGIDGVEHTVEVDGGEIASALGAHMTMKFVKAGCQATINSIDANNAKVSIESDLEDEEDDEEFDEEFDEDDD